MARSKTPPDSTDTSSTFEEEDFPLDKIECAKIDADDVWYYLGKFGKYQLIQSFLLILAGIGLTPVVIGGMFTGKEVTFKCAGNSTLDQRANNHSILIVSECRVKTMRNDSSHVVADESCEEFDYEHGNRHNSYISEWDLVCDKEAVGHLAQILTMVGMGVGAFFLPSLGDRFGRKKLLIASELTVLVVMASMAFAPSFEVFVFLKFLSGAANQGQCVSAATLHMELYPIELRSAVGFILIVIWVISYSLHVGIAWFLHDYSWQTLQLAFACFSTAVFLQLWFQDESLRWLMGNGRVKQARRVMMRACKLNKKSFPNLISSVLATTKTKQNYGLNDEKEILAEQEKLPTVEVKGTQRKARISPFDLIKTPGLRTITIVMAYTWCINSLTYYGLTLMTSSLFGDPYLNNLIAALLELLSGVLMFYAVFKFGRKRTLIVFILLAGVCLFLTVLVFNLAPSTKGYFILQTALTQMGKCFISGSFNTIWCYTPELFPTNIRNMGLGVSSSSARVGAAFSPLFNLLVKKAPWAPGTIFSASCFLCAFLLMILPETRWRELPTSIKEVEGWFQADKEAKALKKNKKTQPEDEEQELNKIPQDGDYEN